MQEVEAPFDEVFQPIKEEEKQEDADDEAKEIRMLTKGNHDDNNYLNKEEEEEIPDLQMDSMLTSGSSFLEQSMMTPEDETLLSSSIFRTTPETGSVDAKSTSLLLQDDDEEDEDDSPTASIVTSNSSFANSVAEDESSLDTNKVRLQDFDDRFDHESAAFALVETMCAPVDLVCHTGTDHKSLMDDDNVTRKKKENMDDDDDTYTFFPRKVDKESSGSKFKLGYAACGAGNEEEDTKNITKSIMSETYESWNMLVQKMGSQLTLQEFLERPTPSFQSSTTGGNNDS